MVTRLKKNLDPLISLQLSAFVGGRLIQDNLVAAHEAFYYLKRKDPKYDLGFALKLDMNKVYDKLEWSFLKKCLQAYEFSPRWVDCVMILISSISYVYQVNGFHSDTINPQRGLRQGDPLSPYLFILAFDALSRLITSAQNSSEMYQIDNILNVFTAASGQMINLTKSGIIHADGINNQTRFALASIINVPIWDNPGKYLGIPTQWGRAKGTALNWLKERIVSKLKGW